MQRLFVLLLGIVLLVSAPPGSRFNMIESMASNNRPVHNLNTELNYAKIQEAIDAPETASGHMISADAGTYFEDLTISKSISLVGEGRNSTIIDGGGIGTVIEIKADEVSILNLTVRNAGTIWREQPWYIEGCVAGSRLTNVTVENVICTGGAVSLWFDHSFLVHINNCVVSGSTYMGIGGYNLQNATIYNNIVFSYGSDGIHLDGGSRYCSVVNNVVSGGFDGISLETNPSSPWPTSDNLIDGNSISNITVASIGVFNCGPNAFRRNNMTGTQNNLAIWGSSSDAFMQDIDTSNTANSKFLYYMTNRSDFFMDPLTYPNASYIAIVKCSNVTVRNFDLTSCMDGMLVAGSNNCTLMNVTIGNNKEPQVYLGVPLIHGGITIFKSNYNIVLDSKIYNNSYGICLYHSDMNTFYHNTFKDLDKFVISDYTSIFRNASSGYISKNSWDNGQEGNYWSYPNLTDADHDGIGDSPFEIDAHNADRHPLMGEFQSFTVPTQDTDLQRVEVISNSTVTDLELLTWLSSPFDSLEPGQKLIRFFAEGKDETAGFCRLVIPRTVLNSSSYIVLVDLYPVNATELPLSTSAYVYLYFTYIHSTHEVIVTIPEFTPLLGPSLFIIATLIAAMLNQKKHITRKP